jgi:hydroxymethylpyrimidine/phosphomethylpyrimidine kinase
MRTALTIAGSDSGGGAGIQADLRTFTAFGVHGTSAITAVTAQNTLGVTAVLALPPDMVVAQIDAVIEDLGAHAVKLGMLANGAITGAVAEALVRHRVSPVVLDPVMVAKGGARLLDEEAVAIMRSRLFGLSTVVTANVPEAEALTGLPVTDLASARRAAIAIVEAGAQAAIVKGGHLSGDAIDVLFDGTSLTEFASPRAVTTHTHGTGCTFAAAIAANLALGATLVDAVGVAKAYVTRAIERAPGLGHGHGPLGLGR